MAGKTKIEWSECTWNPVRGCTKVSPGCRSCYAETFAERFRGVAGHPYEQGFDPRTAPDQLDAPLHWRKPRTIFVNSMSDLFGEFVSDDYIAAVFGVMGACPQHTHQVLTKRAARLSEWFVWVGDQYGIGGRIPASVVCDEAACTTERSGLYMHRFHSAEKPWPLPNVHLGVSVEDRKYGLPRIDHLRRCPAAVRFLSIEPLLEDLGEFDLTGIHWVIVGGESGPGARPMHPAWVRRIREQCVAAGVPFFFKQWGAWHQGLRRVGKKLAGRLLDGRTWDEMPSGLLAPQNKKISLPLVQ